MCDLEPRSHDGEAVPPPARPSFNAGGGVAHVEPLPRRRRHDGEGPPAGILLTPVGEDAAVEEAAQLVGPRESRWRRSERAGEAPWPRRRRGTGEGGRGKPKRGDPLPRRRGHPPPRYVVIRAAGLHARL
jgi:hypothetical protein